MQPGARAEAAPPPALRLRGITKRFGALLANDDISLELARGEALALLGENGAGKSTLVSILFGHYVADRGTIEVDGRPLAPGRPDLALAAGVGMVHQHFTLADNLSVLDNVMLGTEPLWRPSMRRRAARERLLAAAARAGLAVDPEARVGSLSVGERQRVELLKAIVRGARILILDEPTAVLAPPESRALIATLRQMVEGGMSIVFISHKLDEALAVAHRVAVLRAGRLVAVRPAAGADPAELAAAMVGRRIAAVVRGQRADADAPVVCRVPGTGLALRAGEVLAVAGVAGNGQRALAERLFGERADAAGAVEVGGHALAAEPRRWIDAGVARVPEDRQGVGVVGELPLWENLLLERYRAPAFARFGLVRRGAARAHARSLIERFDIRGGGVETPAAALSGGNMQKLVLARALGAARPTLVVAEQPTWGLDLGAVAQVHQRLLDAAAAGSAVLLISEDLDEVFALADRIAVIHRGRIGAARPASAWTAAELGLAMGGTAPPAADAA